ncbi:cobalamin-binding protein [Dechloromonas sp. XY25]|uniref:Cobalamin-binding protein n=1 Tax=Dechloromonas hankyongensis TaxID=2908002 RepID=A0ABS9JYI1_9RHOO|nr:cobalamin-binding protein [Dechloromonas hankyongensis]MCG2575959.1 cobalamin-binding protein [Dechloromonas hankyongensis]
MPRLPQRIVCLTTETVEVLYALGEQERIVGISGYTVRPPEARKEKPKVFAFTSGDIEKILATQPDLVLTFSDLQSDISRDLIKAGVPVYAFNTRSVEDILGMIETVGRLVGAEARAQAIVAGLEAEIARTRAIAAERLARTGRKPRVYFEEWDEPLISSIRWASELIEMAGGEDVFAERARSPLAKDRRPTAEEVIATAPDIIIGSWCGKHFRPERVAARPGWANVPAVRHGRLHEIKSAVILTPGPVAISEGLPALLDIFDL